MLRMKLRLILALAIALPVGAQTVADNSKPASPAPEAASASTGTNSIAEPLSAAQSLMNKMKFTEATAAFRAILEKNPASAEAHTGLVRSLLRVQNLDEARAAARSAVAAVPTSALVHAAAGDVAFRDGKFADSESEYRNAVKLDPNCARAVFGMGRMFEMVSMNKRAKDVYIKAHQLDPDDEQITDKWLESLPYADALEALKKTAGGAEKNNRIALLSALAQRKPWVLASELKPTELKMQPYGRELAGVYDIKRNGPMNVSKGYGLPVRFNDRAGAVLLLDTGAGGITIGRKLAEKAGAVKIANTRLGGIGDRGSIESYIAWIDKITIGGVEFHNCTVVVSSRNNIADEAGLIGPDVFEKFLITLDFREQRVLLAPLPKSPNPTDDERFQDRFVALEMQSFTKYYSFGHDIVVPVVVND
ncbi:MAG TPA: tetratricopeptide repeat protein, partial [Candidatus Sulfotelmatobacter sp.]|nr:tetratricopeptide repeat protein [Candidatus Sulfotelmatobacter sp.]